MMFKEPLTTEHIKELMTANGLTFSDCIRAFAAPNDHPAIVKARETIARDGEIEIDDHTLISGSDGPGEYVLAWVWVDLADDYEEEET